jgi:hypothetical protein
MRRKQDIANAVLATSRSGWKMSGPKVPLYECEVDPCGGTPPPPYWPPSGPPSSKTLDTRSRQQITNYYCGPASGQVVINLSRGYFFNTSTVAGAEDLALNWRKQSKIGQWMGTTTAGTGGAALAAGLNNPNAVLKPTPEWVYSYASTGNLASFHSRVVTDVAKFGLPIVLATAPHQQGAGVNYLQSWPTVFHNAHHWITIKGYSGLPGTSGATMSYEDSSAGYGGRTGSYSDAVSVLWQVNDWNQGGHLVW